MYHDSIYCDILWYCSQGDILSQRPVVFAFVCLLPPVSADIIGVEHTNGWTYITLVSSSWRFKQNFSKSMAKINNSVTFSTVLDWKMGKIKHSCVLASSLGRMVIITACWNVCIDLFFFSDGEIISQIKMTNLALAEIKELLKQQVRNKSIQTARTTDLFIILKIYVLCDRT